MGFIWWLSSIPRLSLTGNDTEPLLRAGGQLLAFGFLFLLIYRALLTSFKFRVERLAFWRTRKEKSEDTEFVFIVETLLLFIAVLLSILYAIVDEYHQSFVDKSMASARDVLLDTIGILTIALITYSLPIIAETEVFAVRKLFKKKQLKAD
ncbi:VanZ family protein [Candidatus Dojkabacteria bacterium]|nr:VanZ family protein [Candidatus Dojkabacteria bacterium]